MSGHMTAGLDHVDSRQDLNIPIDHSVANQRIFPDRSRELESRRITCPCCSQMAPLNHYVGVWKRVGEPGVVGIEMRDNQAVDIFRREPNVLQLIGNDLVRRGMKESWRCPAILAQRAR